MISTSVGRFVVGGVALAALLSACTENRDNVALGRVFAETRGCPTCHQSTLASDKTLSGQTDPRPGSMAYGSNISPDHETGIGDWADIEIVRAMRYGVDNEQQPLCPTMPNFSKKYTGKSFGISDGEAMTDLEAYDIVAYLRSLPAVHREIPESMCPPLKPLPEPDTSDDMSASPIEVDLANILANIVDGGA